MLNDLEIAQGAKLKPVTKIAEELGIPAESLYQYGPHMAKVKLAADTVAGVGARGKYVVVTGISPTKFGEGKTTTTLGIAQALTSHIKVPAIACLRQSSQGLTFGTKGGCAGGGYAQLVPMEEANLHLTGDFHAISAAHNLLAAAIFTRIIHESKSTDEQLLRRMCPLDARTGKHKIPGHLQRRQARLGLDSDIASLSPGEVSRLVRLNVDPDKVYWRRVVDCNDKMLRHITTVSDGVSIEDTGFDITPASEIMAIVCQAVNLADIRERLAKMVVAVSTSGEPLTAEDFGAVGAMTVLLKDVIYPTLVQSLEGGPVFIHGGPFASIAHGCSSSIADRIALTLVGPQGLVLTEAGFGSDLGFEKFVNIKCRQSGLAPDAAVITATVRGLRAHSTIADECSQADQLASGLKNLEAHIRNVKQHGVPVVVAINRFASDSSSDVEAVVRAATQRFGADAAVPANFWGEGGRGAVDLGRALINVANKQGGHFRMLYSLENTSIEERIRTIATHVYGAKDVQLSDVVRSKIQTIHDFGLANLPICMAKTSASFSHDPALRGAPTGFTLPVVDIRAFSGAGHIVAYVGDISLMPALGTAPSFFEIDILPDGRVVGLA